MGTTFGVTVMGAPVAGDAVLAGAAALVAGAAAVPVVGPLLVIVDVEVVDEVDDVLTVDSGVDASGLDSWSSRSQPLINTTKTAAAAGTFRTAAVFHDR